MANSNWSLTGNGGTDPAANFIGTTDQQPLVIGTNGIEAVHINPGTLQQVNGFARDGGNVGIGTDQPQGKLHVSSPGNFGHPQVEITQMTPFEFARLRFFTFGHELVGGSRATHFWDVAATDRLNFFSHNVGNVMTLWGTFDQHTRTFLPRVGIGTENPSSTLEVNGGAIVGSLEVNGTATVEILQITGGSDLAEHFQVNESSVEPGTVMVIDEKQPGHVRICNRPYDCKVAGVVSGAGGVRPGLTLKQENGAEGSTILALTGRVYCKAEAYSHSIEVGDLLTTSGIRGHAMKAADPTSSRGAVLGKAMSGLKTGIGLVLVLVNLQ